MKLKSFVSVLSAEALIAERYRQRETYDSVYNRVCGYAGSANPSLKEVFTPGFLNGFQKGLLKEDLHHNTISFYINGLRSIQSSAVEAGRLPACPDLFSGLITNYVPTEKRALSDKSISRIFFADLPGKPHLELYRALFVLSVFLQGMAPVDLLHLRKSDLQGNMLICTRQKTGRQVGVYVLDEAREIIFRMMDDQVDTPYLLPFITLKGEEGRRQYNSWLHLYNRRLKELADYLNIPENLSSYVARHTWATLAHHNGVETPLVSQAMGHSSEKTTQTYLASFGKEHLKGANQTVLNAVLRAAAQNSEEQEPQQEPVQPEAQPIPACSKPLYRNIRKVKSAVVTEPAVVVCAEPAVVTEPTVACTEPAIVTKPAAVVYTNPVAVTKPAIPVYNSAGLKEKEYVNRAERRRLEKEKRKEEKRMKRGKQKMSIF
jgi:integrase